MTPQIEKTLKEFYPQAYKEFSSGNKSELPLSKETFFLSQKNWQSIQEIVQAFYKLKESSIYQTALSKKIPEIAQEENRQNSPLMAYDFHIEGSSHKVQDNSHKAEKDSLKGSSNDSYKDFWKTQESSLKLIEINTNASAFLLSNLLYQSSFSQGFENSLKELKKAFFTEWELFNPHKKTPKIVLIDENIESQKMRFEFFMYQDFFNSMGWKLEILDSKSLLTDDKAFLYTPQKEKIDFIYNRSTDFYFANHPKLKKAYQEKSCLILPQPRDYALLADKKRFLDWQGLLQLESMQKHLLKIKLFNEKNKEELWKDRKKYFFKIQQGYGGKLAYRGSSLSHKKKEELLKHESLAQEYSPPSSLIDAQGQKWKVDLRAYTYKNQIQQLIARIYQGQLTNFKVKGSGFAKVKVLP